MAQLGHQVPDDPTDTFPTEAEQAILDCTAENFDLAVYLVASHHGKVRASLHASPKDQDYRSPEGDDRGLPIRGVRTGDQIFELSITEPSSLVPAIALSLEPATFGLSSKTGRSWRDRTLGLLDRCGPGALAWLEALMIAADRRASRLTTIDPQLTPQSPERK